MQLNRASDLTPRHKKILILADEVVLLEEDFELFRGGPNKYALNISLVFFSRIYVVRE